MNPAGENLPEHRGPVLELGDRPPMNAVRRWTERAVPHVVGESLEDLLLLVTELVSNAYDHGRRPGRLRLLDSCDQLRVEVDDGCPEPPVPGRSRIADSRGRGLLLVAALSSAWGHTGRVGGGKTVWADLPLPDFTGEAR
ncbi:putative anti-sigma regulatory factor,serine/threonine protein kinase [Saccharothrix espanaensis DSM 44229]|uniref:Putative anti-sigma regulatory factor,serine/threonine protein kinase n=1 Tax=Saccharothrix espanaensis (strain ATCC 51144 / DSM 44229 / JCM 9112 / NBRC 15066 / NRRL 15764) TaxID=1179773 RepID=K0K2V1_SACES|nr:putative anti-sigma regulatory factor,serine/threonine protein kinase [Saccharothrix espanaensis DSM 44229]